MFLLFNCNPKMKTAVETCGYTQYTLFIRDTCNALGARKVV